jgi:hypothetical protein
MKLNTANSLRTLALLSVALSSSAYAQGISALRTCKSVNPGGRFAPGITIGWKESIDYRTNKGQFEARYSGTVHWDAEPYSLSGKILAELPVSNAPVPDFLPSYSVQDGQSSVKRTQIREQQSATPLQQEQLTFRVPFKSRFVELKVAFGVMGTTGFGVLNLTDGAGKPDPSFGAALPVDLLCEVKVSDGI